MYDRRNIMLIINALCQLDCVIMFYAVLCTWSHCFVCFLWCVFCIYSKAYPGTESANKFRLYICCGMSTGLKRELIIKFTGKKGVKCYVHKSLTPLTDLIIIVSRRTFILTLQQAPTLRGFLRGDNSLLTACLTCVHAACIFLHWLTFLTLLTSKVSGTCVPK